MTYVANGVGVQSSLSVTTGAAVGLTAPTYTDKGGDGVSVTRSTTPGHAQIGIEGNSVRYTVDGTTPTATVGILLPVGTILDWTHPETDYTALIANAMFIGISGTATINVQYRS